ncbi:ribosomal-protein-alanine N-acetyltransferase [Arthrobacter crusticola]|uniref:Ribosomal-protein-alanine N-acetyltransferase n=1 Tax=Arthrobacter crusticola TaxID=2547960 RepID=A0A4R5TXA3_9MICC|nr:ribosomal protein S18-alanine N-acetyltransferase [Arthrobacter crusticola]TDK25738.1 ribosomal-protein-alanine N-acetyltransferase [Arthrobacter crusticola]
MSFSLRDLDYEDIKTVGSLEQELFPIDAWPLQMFYEEFFRPDTRRYIVAEVDGAIVGYAGVMTIDTTADIQTIAVLPGHEGRGIGTAMLHELLAEAARRGAREVLLEVRADNPRAQLLYTRTGFTKISTRRRYYRDGVDAWVMRLELPPGGAPGDGGPESGPNGGDTNDTAGDNDDESTAGNSSGTEGDRP